MGLENWRRYWGRGSEQRGGIGRGEAVNRGRYWGGEVVNGGAVLGGGGGSEPRGRIGGTVFPLPTHSATVYTLCTE